MRHSSMYTYVAIMVLTDHLQKYFICILVINVDVILLCVMCTLSAGHEVHCFASLGLPSEYKNNSDGRCFFLSHTHTNNSFFSAHLNVIQSVIFLYLKMAPRNSWPRGYKSFLHAQLS